MGSEGVGHTSRPLPQWAGNTPGLRCSQSIGAGGEGAVAARYWQQTLTS